MVLQFKRGIVVSALRAKPISVRLRPLRLPEDIETALGWYQDPEVLFYSEGPGVTGFNRTRIERMYRWLLGRGEVFFIEVEGFEGTWQPVGDVALCETMIPIVIGEPHIGIGEWVAMP